MQPMAEYLTAQEASEYMSETEGFTAFEAALRAEEAEEYEAGWYSRLSASGYLDCTDWQGPYKNAFRAIRAVCELYEVNVRGDQLS